MANDKFCPTHGPYNATLGSCPFCNASTYPPQEPGGLDDEDNMPTQVGGPQAGQRAPAGWDSEQETQIPGSRRQQPRGGVGFDLESEDSTQLGRMGHDLLDETEVEVKQTVTQAILWVKEGSRRGKIYNLKDSTVIGRKNCDLVLDDSKVSGMHAKIVRENGEYTLWDFGSTNGTSVNGEKIRAATPLKENDTIKIGDTVFVLKILD